MIKKWKMIKSRILLDHDRIKVVEDVVELPDGSESAYIHEGPAVNHSVAVLAINTEDEILLQHEYSYPPDEVLYQLPGGAMNSGEEIIEAANRELSEESGYIGQECTVLGSFYINNRRSDRKQYVVLCRGLKKKKAKEDNEEFIENEWVTRKKLRLLIKDKHISNMNLLAALTLLEVEESKE